MGFTQVHKDRLAPNPYVVYFSSPPLRNALRTGIIESGCWFGEEQTHAIRNYLTISPVFGDPVMALVMCAVGYEKHYNVDASWVSGRDDEGELVWLSSLLGDAEKEHVWRCRESVYRLRDSVEWACLCDDETPGKFWVDDDVGTLLCWANAHGIPLTESGAARYGDYIRSVNSVCPSVFPSHLLRLNPDYGLVEIPASIEECRHPLKGDYEQDWTDALRERLKQALAQVGLNTDTDHGEAVAQAVRTASAVERTSTAKTGNPSAGHLAEDVGVFSWGELHVAWCTNGLRVKKKGAPGEGRLEKWQDLGWTVRDVGEDKRICFLGRMAAGEGSFEEENSHSVASVRKRVEQDLCRRFGLPGGRKKGPLYYKAGRSYTRFGVFCMARDVLKDAPGKQPYRE